VTDEEILVLFDELSTSVVDDAWAKGERPLLAHYTSIRALEKILRDDEIWFSNPLFMNDLEEMRFGFNVGFDKVMSSPIVNQASGSDERAAEIRRIFLHYYQQYDAEHAFNVYVFCASRHDPEDNDGRLSMWRAYGGNGAGASIVFNTASLGEVVDSPLIIAKVRYASPSERSEHIESILEQWGKIVASHEIASDKLYLVTYRLFYLIELFALTTKHRGFVEEEEWRIIYMPDRDTKKLLTDRFDYDISGRGVEPKLKLKLTTLPEGLGTGLSLATLLDRIILGPSISTTLARKSIVRMLEKVHKAEFVNRVFSSSIPLRPV
jgi:hypothetical protein